jgi:hypothetical protein
MRPGNKTQLLISTLGCLALGLSATRCSPLAQSISKSTYGVPSTPHVDQRTKLPGELSGEQNFVAIDTVVEPAPQPSPAPSPSANPSPSPSPEMSPKSLDTDEQTITLPTTAIDEFRETGRTVIDAPAVSRAGSALFVVQVHYSAEDIQQLKLDKFKVLATGMKNGMVGIEIRKDIDPMVVETVENQLVGIRIIVQRNSAK